MDIRVLIFKEEDFPFVNATPIDIQEIVEALPPVQEVRSVGVGGLKERLHADSIDLLINPYGSAFPKDAWPEIYEYLAAGGNLLNLGGAPFSVPVRRDDNGWHQEIRQTQYHRELGINQAYPVETTSVKRYDTTSTEPLLSGLIDEFSCEKVFELQVKFTSRDDHPGEFGTSGAREAVLRPLLYALDSEGRRIAAPIVAIDRVLGTFAGGRWVLANFQAHELMRQEAIGRLAAYAALGATDMQIRPSFASYKSDERASLILHVNRFEKPGAKWEPLHLFLTIRKEKTTVKTESIDISDFASPYYLSIPVAQPLTPGLYTIEAKLSTGNPELTDKYADYASTGFWCCDSALIKMTQPLSAGSDYFARESKPIPLLGTTYMASDVHRKFLFEPNPAAWDRDFTEMKANGINIVRTGIWTGFRRIMMDPGAPSEEVLRAFEAFMLTAAQHEMPVIFTFFTFTPELWEGVNPYLDPRCLQAQKEYIAAFARRFAGFNNLMWDLINEPSFLSHGRIWTCRPNHDEFEERAWKEWLAKRYESTEALDEAWRMTPRTSKGLPDLRDFDDRQIFEDAHPMRKLDYILFLQEVFNNWVKEMTAVIRQNGNPKQLITVGQDEGGTHERPNPQFHCDCTDYTCNHTWWLMDDLLWDGLVTKTPGKPNLIEETGIMFVENPDRSFRRTEEDCRNLLERKFVMAFASGGAGAVQWIWNSNVYMTSDNEVAIGFHRADLTRKPEIEFVRPMSEFLREARTYFIDRQTEDVCMVIPHSSMFSVRDLATPATKTCVRAMSYHLGVPMRAVGEYRLDNLGSPKLIVLPSPGMLSRQAWETLMRTVEAGSTLLVTGPIDFDEYRRPVDRLAKSDIEAVTRPVTREEEAIIFGSEYRLSFGGDKIARIDKAVLGGLGGTVRTEQIGAGKLVYAALPFELADGIEPTIALYEFALKQAMVQPPFMMEKPEPGVLIRPLAFKDAILYCAVSETDADKELSFTDNATGKGLTVRVPAQRAVMLLLGRDGRVLAQYGECVQS